MPDDRIVVPGNPAVAALRSVAARPLPSGDSHAGTADLKRLAPDRPVAPEIAARVQELLRRPYRMVVRGEPEEGYLAEVPELPGCVTAGDTPAEALDLLRDAMAGWLTVALEHGGAIPEPRGDPRTEYSGRLLLRLPKSVHGQLAAQAEAEGVSLNQLVLTYVSQGLGAAGRGPAAT